MILVAVGTTDFDALIAEMDRLAPALEEKVVMQIGNGQYIPRNAEYFRFALSLAPYYEQCGLVVAHGGFGTVMEVLERGKRLVCVENTAVDGGHQRDLLSTLARDGYLLWCRSPSELPAALEQIKHTRLNRYVPPRCEIHSVITDYLSRAKTNYLPPERRWPLKPSRSAGHMQFRKLVRWAVVSVMYYSGLLFLMRLFRSPHQARILVYHSVSDEPLNPFSVPPGDFEEHIRFLSQEFNVISLEELANCLDNGRDIPPDSVVITLDDGLRDNYVNAYPILKEYQVPATMFLIVDHLRPDPSEPAESADDGEPLFLSWAEVKEMSQNGIRFGSHTLSHRPLTSLPLAEARREIQESKRQLERRLEQPVNVFSYPLGRVQDFNQDIRNVVAESEYICACVGLNGTNGRDTDPYLLKRTKIEVNDGMYVFEKAMKGGLDAFILLNQIRRFLPI